MAVANFEELCRGFCEAAGVCAPDLTPEHNGRIAMEVEHDAIRVVLAYDPHNEPEHALLMAVFGPLPAGRELVACRALLEINCQVHSLGFAFGRNRSTGDIVLKQRSALAEVSPFDLFQRVVEMSEGIRGWRLHHFLIDSVDEAGAAVEGSS